MKVLLVDDDDLILDLLNGVLERENHDVTICANAQEAIDAVNDSYDLVITDIVMPGQDGTKLAKHVKEKYSNTPVIAITGGVENAVQDYEHLGDMFADETLGKPFRPQDLLETIERVTHKGD